MAGNPRYANGHRRRELRRRVLNEETMCALCGEPVDRTLITPHPLSPEVDEIIPVSRGGDPLARANTQLAHRRHMQPTQEQQGTRRHTPA